MAFLHMQHMDGPYDHIVEIHTTIMAYFAYCKYPKLDMKICLALQLNK